MRAAGPGIGARTGARILTEIGDVTRFPTPGHLAAYAGLARVTKQSGRFDPRRAPLTPRQPPSPERPLALSVLQPAPRPSRDYYARKRSEGKQHNAAILRLARRCGDRIHRMLHSGLGYGDSPPPATALPQCHHPSLDKPVGTPSGSQAPEPVSKAAIASATSTTTAITASATIEPTTTNTVTPSTIAPATSAPAT